MERGDRAPVATFVAPGLAAGATLVLDADAAHHARVKRLVAGDRVRVVDGVGTTREGTIARLAKSALEVDVERVESVARPARIALFVPVADRDRMLWLAEKAAELAVAEWRPVLFHRSRSVSPRGEGATFAAKVRARMAAALEQSGGAWLPELHPEASVEEAAAWSPGTARYVLERGGAPMLAAPPQGAAAVVVGPEGGMEPDELARLEGAGWRRVSLGDTTLRFETAALGAVAVLRAALAFHTEG